MSVGRDAQPLIACADAGRLHAASFAKVAPFRFLPAAALAGAEVGSFLTIARGFLLQITACGLDWIFSVPPPSYVIQATARTLTSARIEGKSICFS
jgi:hypothetical protein